VMDNKLHHGANWAGGEIAHFVLDLKQSRKDWRARGHLESVVGADQVAERVRAAATRSPLLPRLLAAQGAVAALFEGRKQGDRQAEEIARELVLYLGIAVAQLAVSYDLPLIVLEGDLFIPLFEEIKQLVDRVIPWDQPLALSALGGDAVLRGAIAAACDHAHGQIISALSQEETRAVAAAASR